MARYNFVAHPRYSFGELKEWAEEHGVAAVCSHPYYEAAAAQAEKKIFTLGVRDTPEGFVKYTKDFADGYNMQWWVLINNEAVLGRVSSSVPLGRSLSQILPELASMELSSSMCFVRVLCTDTEFDFVVYNGTPKDLSDMARDLLH